MHMLTTDLQGFTAFQFLSKQHQHRFQELQQTSRSKQQQSLTRRASDGTSGPGNEAQLHKTNCMQ